MASQEEDNKLEYLSNVNKEQERYDLNVYKKFESILNDKTEKFENKVQSLIEVWKSISGLNFSQFDIKYVIQIIDWAKLHALNIVLTGEWRSTKESFRDSLLDSIEKAQASLASVNDAFSTRCQKLADVVKKPWEDPVLYNLIQERDAEIGSKEIEFFCVETAYLVSVRLKKLCENHCEDLALNLVTNFLKYKKQASIQNFNLNATETQLWFIFDIYIALLYKFQNKTKILEQFEDLRLEEGVQLIKRFAKKRVKISKIWRNCHKISIFGCRFYLSKALMKYNDDVKESLTDLLKTYLALTNTDVLLQEFIVSIRNLTNLADAAGLCSMCEVIHKEGADKLRHFAIEMYIRALTTDMNELERLKHVNEDDKMKATTSRLAHTFSNLADLLDDHVKVARECVLTAFSLEPTKERLTKIEELAKRSGFPVLDTGQEWKCRLHPPILPSDELAWICPECGEWMSKPELTAPLQMNTPLQEALQESVLGISEALCDDLVVCLSNPRYQILSWLLSWGDLYRLCILYLNDPEKTKNFVTELKFVDVDYSMFDHIKREPVDEYTGIEKGYEQYLDLNFVSDEEETSSVSEDSTSHDRYVGLGSDGTGEAHLPALQQKSDPNTLKSLRMFRPNLKRKKDDPQHIVKKVALSAQGYSMPVPISFNGYQMHSPILSQNANMMYDPNAYLTQVAGVAMSQPNIQSTAGNFSGYNLTANNIQSLPASMNPHENSLFNTTNFGNAASTSYVANIIKSNLSFGVPTGTATANTNPPSKLGVNLKNYGIKSNTASSTQVPFAIPTAKAKKNSTQSSSNQQANFVTPDAVVQKVTKPNQRNLLVPNQSKVRASQNPTTPLTLKELETKSYNIPSTESKNGVAATLPQLGGQVANNPKQLIQVHHHSSQIQTKLQPETSSLNGTTDVCKTKLTNSCKQDKLHLNGEVSNPTKEPKLMESDHKTLSPGKATSVKTDLKVVISRLNLEKYNKNQEQSRPIGKSLEASEMKTSSNHTTHHNKQHPIPLKQLIVRIAKLNPISPPKRAAENPETQTALLAPLIQKEVIIPLPKTLEYPQVKSHLLHPHRETSQQPLKQGLSTHPPVKSLLPVAIPLTSPIEQVKTSQVQTKSQTLPCQKEQYSLAPKITIQTETLSQEMLLVESLTIKKSTPASVQPDKIIIVPREKSKETTCLQPNQQETVSNTGVSKTVENIHQIQKLTKTLTCHVSFPSQTIATTDCDKDKLPDKTDNELGKHIESNSVADELNSNECAIFGRKQDVRTEDIGMASDKTVTNDQIPSKIVDEADKCSAINETVEIVNKTLDCDNKDLHMEVSEEPKNSENSEGFEELAAWFEGKLNNTKDVYDNRREETWTQTESKVEKISINTNFTQTAVVVKPSEDDSSAIKTRTEINNLSTIIDLCIDDKVDLDSIQYRSIEDTFGFETYENLQDLLNWEISSEITIESKMEISSSDSEDWLQSIFNADESGEIKRNIRAEQRLDEEILNDFQRNTCLTKETQVNVEELDNNNLNLEKALTQTEDEDEILMGPELDTKEAQINDEKLKLGCVVRLEQTPPQRLIGCITEEKPPKELIISLKRENFIKYLHNYCKTDPPQKSSRAQKKSSGTQQLKENVAASRLVKPSDNQSAAANYFFSKFCNNPALRFPYSITRRTFVRPSTSTAQFMPLVPPRIAIHFQPIPRVGRRPLTHEEERRYLELQAKKKSKKIDTSLDCDKENVVLKNEDLAEALQEGVMEYYEEQASVREFYHELALKNEEPIYPENKCRHIIRPAEVRIYSNSRKRKHDDVPCFKLDQEKSRRKPKYRRLTVALNRLPDLISWPNVTVVVVPNPHVNDDAMDHDAFDLFKKVTPLLNYNVENEISRKLEVYSKHKRSYVKKNPGVHINIYEDKFYSMTAKVDQRVSGQSVRGHVRFKIPGLHDYSQFLPRNVNHTVNVVQHSNPRSSTVTNQNTQTSTQVTPHIQRVGQPKVSDIKPERYEEECQQPSSSATALRPGAAAQSALINILNTTKPGPKTLPAARQTPYVNILSQQILRPQTLIEPTATVIKVESEENAEVQATKTVNTNVRIVTTTTQAGAATTTSTPAQGGTILQLICKSSSLPKFQQAFGKTVYQGGNSTENDSETPATTTNENSIQPQTATVVEAKKISTRALPVNVQPITGNVIFRGQVPVGQTVSLIPPGSNTRQLFRITGSTHEQISLVKETVIQNKMSALLAAALQGKPKITEQNGELVEEYSATRITLCRPGTVPPNATRIVKPVQLQIPANVIRAPQPNVSSTTLEQLREFDMVYKQVKERSSNPSQPETNPQTSQESPQQQRISFTYVNQVQKYTQLSPVVVVSSYSPIQQSVSPALNVTSQSSSGPCLTQVSTVTVPKVAVKSSKGKSIKSSVAKTSPTTVPAIPKPQQKPQEDEHTTQRIFDILAEYAEQLRNSPDLNNKPAPRRRSNPPTNPSSSTSTSSSKKKKKKSSSSNTSTLVETDNEDLTMGSEDSSGGNVVQLSMTDEEQSQSASITPPESNLEPATSNAQPSRPLIVTDSSNQPRNVIIADSSVGEALKMPNTALLMPGNYIMPVSVVKGGQQIAVVSGGSKILTTVPARSGQNMLLFQSFVNQNKKGGISTVKYSTLQPFSGISTQTVAGVSAQSPVVLPSNSVATVALGQPITLKKIDDNERGGNTELLLTISQARDAIKIEKSPDIPQPDSSTNLSSDEIEIKLEDSLGESSNEVFNNIQKTNSVATSVIASVIKKDDDDTRDESADRSINKAESSKQNERIGSVLVNASSANGPMLSHTNARYRKPGGEGVESTTSSVKGYAHNVGKIPQPAKIFKNNTVYYAIRTKKTLNKKLDSEAQKQAAMERELRLQKTLSEECEDLGVDEPSTSDLFPEADLLFDSNHSSSYDQSGQKIQGSDGKAKETMHLFTDDENSGPLRNDLFDYVEYHPEPGAEQINGNNGSNESASCDDSTLLVNCGTMSEVTLNSPISPDYTESSNTINKYKYKYTNRKKGEKVVRSQSEVWQEVTEVTSSEDTMEIVMKEDETPIGIQEETVIGEEAVTKVETVVMEHLKSAEDDLTARCPIHGSSDTRCSRKTKRTCSCFNGSRSPDAKKRVNSPKSHGPNPFKKILTSKKR